MSQLKEVFVLLADSDGTLRSTAAPWGLAVTTEEEAKRYVKKGGIGYTHSYIKIKVVDTYEDAIKQECVNNNR